MPNRSGRREDRLSRSSGTERTKPRLTVFVEGKSTEDKYLNAFKADHLSDRLNVDIVPMGSRMEDLFDRAREAAKAASESAVARKSGDAVWCVFDHDKRENILNDRAALENDGVRVAFSNPCFELWGVFHFMASIGTLSNARMQKELSKHLPSYNHQRGATMDYKALKPFYGTAKSNAANACACRERDGEPHGNPSTNIHELLEDIRKAGRDPAKYPKHKV